MLVTTNDSQAPQLGNLVDEEHADGERVSVTDVHGTVARFEMAYTPESGERFAFGPPLATRLPSLVYLAVALAAGLAVVIGYSSSSNSALFRYIVEGDKHRVLASPGFALILVASAIGTAVRAQMRGVTLSSEGLETRTLLMFGLPRVRRFAWPQIDRIVMDERHTVMLELWDGTYQRLPDVADGRGMTQLLEKIANGKRLPVTRLERLER